jgi:hypothetical protein
LAKTIDGYPAKQPSSQARLVDFSTKWCCLCLDNYDGGACLSNLSNDDLPETTFAYKASNVADYPARMPVLDKCTKFDDGNFHLESWNIVPYLLLGRSFSTQVQHTAQSL